jgi:hypothetical protein
MRRGMDPQAAAEEALRRILAKYPGYVGALFALSKDGSHGAAAHGWEATGLTTLNGTVYPFMYAYRDARSGKAQVVPVPPI